MAAARAARAAAGEVEQDRPLPEGVDWLDGLAIDGKTIRNRSVDRGQHHQQIKGASPELRRVGLRHEDDLLHKIVRPYVSSHPCPLTGGNIKVSGLRGQAHLRYRNHKMRREAMVPIDDSLAAAIQARRQQMGGQHTATALFPRDSGNPDQRLPLPAATFNIHLQQWLTDCHVVDESGAPVKVTAHQFRHTYATRLINSEVPQEVVRRLLDHTSHTMTAHYARLADATIREQWQRAQKVNIHGEPVDLPDNQAMADAAWMKQNLARAKITLPNGYCGLPLQKSCPHANACLTCPLFITTAEFLPQHQRQLADTRQLITTAEAAGNDRVVQMNCTVETNLLTIITTLERGHEPQHKDRCQQPDRCGTGCCDASR